jgi:hypothetical protein
MPDYVVIRPAADLPAGFLPADLDGKWFDRSTLPTWIVRDRTGLAKDAGPGGVAVPAGRFEVRDDGAVAEVFEVQV